MKKVYILHLEDNSSDAQLVHAILKHSDLNFEIEWVNTKEKFEAAILNPAIEIVLADYSIPNYNGLFALDYTKQKRPDVPFILISGTIGEEKTIEIFQAGATDYIVKDNLQRIEPSIKRALKEMDEKHNRKIVEEKLKEKERLFNQFTENIHEVFWRGTPGLDSITYISPAYEKIWGRSKESLYQNPNDWLDAVPQEEQQEVLETLGRFIDGKDTHIELTYNIIRPDGQKRFIVAQISKAMNNNIMEIIGVAVDGTEREKTRLLLVSSLKEKEVMLKEIYHRVKNNLQVVNSLLNIQAKSITDTTAKKIFIESASRVKAMSLVHEMLYRSGDLTQIEMGKYVTELFKQLNEIYKVKEGLIHLITNIEGIQLNLESAVPCGLILNELISNSFKYAFPNGRTGKITLTMQKNQQNIKLVFGDDGVGLPAEIDFKNTQTLGLQLINKLIKQLDGTVTLDRSKGAIFTLTFPNN